MCDMERLTDGIRRLCGVTDGVRPNEFAEVTVRKAAVAEACDALDAEVEAARAFAREEGRAEGRREAEAELAPRIMPEGMEWPMVDGKPVDFTTGYEPSLGVLEAVSIYSNGACEAMSHDGIIKSVKDIHVSKPKALDADGAEIRVGDVLYRKSDGHMVKVAEVYEKTFTDADDYVRPGDGFTHRAPVFAADGRPLREGEHVYHVETGAELVVKELPKPGEYQGVVVFAPPASHLTSFDPDQLTHERPDSWERLEEDATIAPVSYCVGRGLPCIEVREGDPEPDLADFTEAMARDLVRRARALAERERGA